MFRLSWPWIPSRLNHFHFQSKNLTYSIKIEDFADSINNELRQIEEESSSGLQFRDPSNRLAFDLFNYHKLEEIDEYLNSIENSKADLAADFSSRFWFWIHKL